MKGLTVLIYVSNGKEGWRGKSGEYNMNGSEGEGWGKRRIGRGGRKDRVEMGEG